MSAPPRSKHKDAGLTEPERIATLVALLAHLGIDGGKPAKPLCLNVSSVLTLEMSMNWIFTSFAPAEQADC